MGLEGVQGGRNRKQIKNTLCILFSGGGDGGGVMLPLHTYIEFYSADYVASPLRARGTARGNKIAIRKQRNNNILYKCVFLFYFYYFMAACARARINLGGFDRQPPPPLR